jgi:hypothetical protein
MLMRLLMTFCIGVAVVGIGVTTKMAWQSYGDAAREAIAPEALKGMSVDLDTVRRNVDRIATNMATSQEQMTRSIDQLTTGLENMTREITKLQAVEHMVFDKISMGPPSTSVSKPILQRSRASNVLTPARNP